MPDEVTQRRARGEPAGRDLLQQVLALVAGPQRGTLEAPWVERFEQLLVEFQQAHQPHQSPLEGDMHTRAGHARLHRLEAYLAHHLAAPLTLADMAEAADVSVRTLNALCRELRDCTPMELLRNTRLDTVRVRLQDGTVASVTEAALECGFTHLGRFAAYYRDRFGETPAQTRLRTLGGAWRSAPQH